MPKKDSILRKKLNSTQYKKPIFDIIFRAHDTIYLPEVYNIRSLEACYRCRADTGITYACEHTQERKMCTECYEFIHWAINNKNVEIAKTQ
jgi:hypothetical protein